jgi:hypothetical protein
MNTPGSLLRLVLVTFLLASVGALRGEDKPSPAETVPPSVLKRYDKNKDGALDEKERGKWEADKAARREKDRVQRAEMLEKFDTNKDGRLSEEERAAAKLAMERVRTEQEGEKMKERAAKAEQEAKDAAAKEAEKSKAKEKEKPAEDMMGGDSMMME